METIRISGLDEGRNAMRANPRAELALPVDAGGAAWAAEIARILRAEFPDAVVAADCGTSAGAAMAALREGLTRIDFAGPAAVADKLAAMGAKVTYG